MKTPSLIFAVGLAGSVSLALATTTAHASPFAGFYLGGQFGYTDYIIKLRAADETFDGLGASGPSGGVFVGAGTVQYNNLYLGLEAHYMYGGAEFKTSGSDGRYKLEVDNSHGLTAHLGSVFNNDTLFYGLLGYQRTKLEDNAGSENFDGLRIGGGTAFQMDTRVFIRAEYSRTFYDDKSWGDKVEPESSQIYLGVGYRF